MGGNITHHILKNSIPTKEDWGKTAEGMACLRILCRVMQLLLAASAGPQMLLYWQLKKKPSQVSILLFFSG
jgi:hypothetical protein